MRSPRGVLLLTLLLGCGARAPKDSGAADTASDTASASGRPDDTLDTAVDDTGRGETGGGETGGGDTGGGTTAATPLGSIRVRATLGGVTRDWACIDTGLIGGWVDALGNIAGSVTCSAEAGDALALTFTRGSTGSWTDPSGGVDFVWQLADGTRLDHAAAALTVARWQVDVTRWERLSLETIALEATLGATWTDDAGVEAAALDATLTVTLPG